MTFGVGAGLAGPGLAPRRPVPRRRGPPVSAQSSRPAALTCRRSGPRRRSIDTREARPMTAADARAHGGEQRGSRRVSGQVICCTARIPQGERMRDPEARGVRRTETRRGLAVRAPGWQEPRAYHRPREEPRPCRMPPFSLSRSRSPGPASSCTPRRQPQPPDPQRRFLEIADFRFEGGGVLPKARVAYATFGTLNAARDNAVLLTTSYGADYHVYDFVVGPGKAFDPARHFIVTTEMFGNGCVVVAEQHAGARMPAPTSRPSPSATTSRRRVACSSTWASRTCAPSPAFRWARSSRSSGRCRTPASWTRSSRGAARRRPIRTASSGSRARSAR